MSATAAFVLNYSRIPQSAWNKWARSKAHTASDQQAPIVHVHAAAEQSNARSSGKRLINDQIDGQERATPDGMHEGVCLDGLFLLFLTSEGLTRERGRKEIRNALEHRSKRDPHVSDGLCARSGLANPTSAPGDWPHRCHVCTGTVLRAASFGARTDRDSVPVHGTKVFRRNRHNRHRRVGSIVPNDVDLHRCHYGTASVFHVDVDGRPTVLIELPLPPSDPNAQSSSSSSHVIIRRRCAFGPRTNSQTGRLRRTLRILLSVPPIQPLSLLPRLDSCRVISSAVGKQSTPRAAPDNSASDTEGAEEETDGAARSDAFAEASLADELAADENDAAVEP